ncbi:hypothetical protein KKI90_16890 [Xenorhabdus bovienii]|uniref:hypothetical protein n=1 Tax=Xenorhabdus bovienii TaxID=40576 RepID=UPI00237C9F60|nr:hypothetical protein [Xenorhabdus bovienii]MDE1487980.1 hypothetical protein [Xenorhabdus bovienii]MDE9477762.1 hypothetical protein [Xenorhabdus bovienii]MDE9530618.1 hypothetical protein [Xenorhabdus bovienii]
MKKLLLLTPFLLIGCVTKVSDYQAMCEQQYSRLSDMANCLDASIRNDQYLSMSTSPKLYTLTAKSLGEDVDQGKISDTKARLELQNLYVNLQQQEYADQIAQHQAFQQSEINSQAIQTMQSINNNVISQPIYTPPPRKITTTSCMDLGSMINCSSY